MARVTDAILKNTAFSIGHNAPMLDPTYGGQMGYSPDLTEWVSNQNYVRRHVICLLLEAPKFFQLMPNPDYYVRILRAMVERHPRTIEGLNRTLTVSVDETPVGGGGEMQQDFTDVKRARSEPSFTFDEKYGAPFQTFLQTWIQYGLLDPNAKTALIGTLQAYPTDMLADMYSATMIFIEPDPTQRQVVKAFLSTNMFPLGSGDIIGSRDQANAMQLTPLTVQFSALTQVGLGVDAFAQTLLDGINFTNANPYLAPSFINAIDPDVASAQSGYGVQVADLAASQVTGTTGTPTTN